MLTIPNRTPSDNRSEAFLLIKEDKTTLTAKRKLTKPNLTRWGRIDQEHAYRNGSTAFNAGQRRYGHVRHMAVECL